MPRMNARPVVAVAAIAAFVPARRTGAVDPIVVLRND